LLELGWGLCGKMGINWECFKHMFMKPFTKLYPKEKVITYPKTRGRIKFDSSKCIGAKECVKNCPAYAIKYIGKGKLEFDMGKCIFCGLCVDMCPTGAISFEGKFDYASNKKEKLVVKS